MNKLIKTWFVEFSPTDICSIIYSRPFILTVIISQISCIDTQSTMLESYPSTAHARRAVSFAQALVENRYSDAHSMLTVRLRHRLPLEQLEDHYLKMIEFSTAPAAVGYPLTTMQYWPDRQPDDVGWVYVPIDSDDFMEAVSVIITKENSELRIRDIEWGRP